MVLAPLTFRRTGTVLLILSSGFGWLERSLLLRACGVDEVVRASTAPANFRKNVSLGGTQLRKFAGAGAYLSYVAIARRESAVRIAPSAKITPTHTASWPATQPLITSERIPTIT